ncbi:MAG TPA: hypothetical protein VH105_21510 [Burkholderiales bacterium]|jgi:hypothetical protein|nr:hypothetical protein [Burkholderiales bacterium]
MSNNKDQVQGEGDYKSAKKFDKAERDFVKSGAVEKAAHKAEPKSDAEAREMLRAEKIGRSHSKGEDRGGAANDGTAGLDADE